MHSNVENTISLSERLNRVDFKVPEYDGLLAMLQRQHESVAVRKNTELPWGSGNRHPVRGVIVTGHHYCGKSDLVGKCLKAVEPVVSVDGQTVEPNTRHIEAPYVFTQASQARAIMAVMGYPLTRKMTADVAWTRLSDRLSHAAVTQIAIDNWHWSFAPSQVGQASREDEKRKIQAAYCNLLDHSSWPLPLVLIGLPEAETQISAAGMEHIMDRCDAVRIERMQSSAVEERNMFDGILKLCEAAKLQLNLVEADNTIQRLIHASDDARGLAITLAKLAVIAAVQSASSRLEIQHFRDAYASTASCKVAEENPFVSDRWHLIDTSNEELKGGMIAALASMNGPKKAVVNVR